MLSRSVSLIGILILTLAALLPAGCGKGDKDKEQARTDKGNEQPGGDGAKGPDKAGARKPDYSLTAEAFSKEFIDNLEKANKKYEGKVIELTGEVQDVSKDTIRRVVVNLVGAKKDPKDAVGVSVLGVLAPAYYARGVLLSPKQKVKLTGDFGQGFRSFVSTGNCTLEELSKSEALQVRAEDLVKDFTKDLQAARKKYTDKWVVVSGQVDDLTKKGGFNYAKLKGDGKLRVSVTMGGDELAHLKKGEDVRLRGMFMGAPGIENNEVALQMGFLVPAK